MIEGMSKKHKKTLYRIAIRRGYDKLTDAERVVIAQTDPTQVFREAAKYFKAIEHEEYKTKFTQKNSKRAIASALDNKKEISHQASTIITGEQKKPRRIPHED